MSVAVFSEIQAMRAAMLAMTEAVYEGTSDDCKMALFDLLTAWGLLHESLAQDERDDEGTDGRAR